MQDLDELVGLECFMIHQAIPAVASYCEGFPLLGRLGERSQTKKQPIGPPELLGVDRAANNPMP